MLSNIIFFLFHKFYSCMLCQFHSPYRQFNSLSMLLGEYLSMLYVVGELLNCSCHWECILELPVLCKERNICVPFLHVFPIFGISCAYHVLFINKSFLPKIRIWTIFCWEWMNLIYPNVLEKIGTGQTLVAYSSGDKCQQVCFNGLICVAMKSFISLVDVIKKRKNK